MAEEGKNRISLQYSSNHIVQSERLLSHGEWFSIASLIIRKQEGNGVEQ